MLPYTVADLALTVPPTTRLSNVLICCVPMLKLLKSALPPTATLPWVFTLLRVELPRMNSPYAAAPPSVAARVSAAKRHTTIRTHACLFFMLISPYAQLTHRKPPRDVSETESKICDLGDANR